jgi:hypothetical protein
MGLTTVFGTSIGDNTPSASLFLRALTSRTNVLGKGCYRFTLTKRITQIFLLTIVHEDLVPCLLSRLASGAFSPISGTQDITNITSSFR